MIVLRVFMLCKKIYARLHLLVPKLSMKLINVICAT